MFSISSFLGAEQIEFFNTSRLSALDNEIEVRIGKELWERRSIWIRYESKTHTYKIAFSNQFGAEEEHELGILTP